MRIFLSPWQAIVALPMLAVLAGTAKGTTLNVPDAYQTIQAAIDAAQQGDVVLVAAGKYVGRIRLKAGVTLKSAGSDEPGEWGLKRAEATIIDGGGDDREGPGVLMAPGAILDGFTVMNVGGYDDALWQKHYDTQGEEQSHEHIGQFGTPGVGVDGVDCTVVHNIVRHNGFTGGRNEGSGATGPTVDDVAIARGPLEAHRARRRKRDLRTVRRPARPAAEKQPGGALGTDRVPTARAMGT